MVWDWCLNNMQPYNIEILFQMVEEDYRYYYLSGEIVGYGAFDVSDFVEDLCKICSAYEYDVLQKVRYEQMLQVAERFTMKGASATVSR